MDFETTLIKVEEEAKKLYGDNLQRMEQLTSHLTTVKMVLGHMKDEKERSKE